jgi:hypothetical protein
MTVQDNNFDYQILNLSSNKLQQDSHELSVELEALKHTDTDYIATKFHGIPIKSFGSFLKDNPFFKLKKIAMDKMTCTEDRFRAIRYMSKIPHKDMLKNTIEAAINVIDDENIPINERWFFMFNNESNLKLNDYIVKHLYIYYFNEKTKQLSNKSSKTTILFEPIYYLLSAQFIYVNLHHDTNEWSKARDYIIYLSLDINESVKMRSEAADILLRKIYVEDYYIGKAVILELGNLYKKNKMSTIYTNLQNAHNETITESVMCVIRNLNSSRKEKLENEEATGFSDKADGKTKRESNTGEIYERLLEITKNESQDKKDKIFSSFNYLLIYPAKYEGLTLSDILVLIWEKILSEPYDIKKELEKRLIEELNEMDEQCGFGYLSRIVNVLSGYVSDENMQIKMNINDQLRSNIFARLQRELYTLNEKQQEEILEEISSENSKKETANEFVISFSVKDELKKEFVDSKLMEEKEFDRIYKICIEDFLGI